MILLCYVNICTTYKVTNAENIDVASNQSAFFTIIVIEMRSRPLLAL